jgi:hypothetical protein
MLLIYLANTGSEASNLQYQAIMSQADDCYEKSKTLLNVFYSNVISPKPNYSLFPSQLKSFVNAQNIAKNCFDELLATQFSHFVF